MRCVPIIGALVLGLLSAATARANSAPFAAPEVKAKPRALVVKRALPGYTTDGLPPPNIAEIASNVTEGAWDSAPGPQWTGANARSARRGVGYGGAVGAHHPGVPGAAAGTAAPDPPSPAMERPRFAQPSWKDPPAPRNLLKDLGSLVNRAIGRVSDTAKLFRRKAILQKVARSMPDLSTDPSGIQLEGARDSQLLTLAPGALQRFERRIDVLHMLGVRHNGIRPENIVIDRYGELQLVDWARANQGGSEEGDLLGLDAVRRFLARRLGS